MSLQSAELLFRQGQYSAAQKVLLQLLKKGQHMAAANRLLGFIAGQTQDFPQAIERLRASLRYDPNSLESWYYLGMACQKSGQHRAAAEAFGTLLQRQPNLFEAEHDLGLALLALGKAAEALAHFDRAVQLRPGAFEAHMNRGAACGKLRLHAQELQCYESALALQPAHPTLIENYGTALCQARRFADAARLYDRTLREHPGDADYAFARGGLLYARAAIADWQDFDAQMALLREDIRAQRECIEPFALLILPSTPQEQLQVARLHAQRHYPMAAEPLHAPVRAEGERLRVGYISADFGRHATSFLVAEVFERHDRERFEVTAISLRQSDGSAMRERLERAFDRFVDAHELSDSETAQAIADLGIDILVDLGGYTIDARPSVLALRPAPLQLSYLCFPGTLGAPFIDYLVADPFLIPEAARADYSEKILYLPDTYQPNDSRRETATGPLSRADAGLPEAAFVFCNFNNGQKLTAAFFDIWLRLLARVEGSVLWLKGGTEAYERNLRERAAAHGIASERLVFAPWAEQSAHLQRLALADLCLDNLPYNAHTTASDALWAGLPLVSCVGQTFAGRVAGSLLGAAGFPQLATDSPAAYEALALALATDPPRLAALRAELATARGHCALFDTATYTRHLENGFAAAWERHRAALPPEHIVVPRLGA